MKAVKYFFPAILAVILLVSGCKNKSSESQNSEAAPATPKTSVTVAYPSDTVQLNEDVTLNATAIYLLKSDVKANTTGYITKMNIKLADHVHRGQTLFVLQTKEARALGSTINKLDSAFRFSGNTSVVSPTTGYVAMLNHQTGDYVQDGEVLATVTDGNSFGFVMEVPYEYNQLIKNGGNLIVNLPDGRNLNGYVAKIMPSVDPAAQTQQVLIKIKNGENIPENLIATVNFVRKSVTGMSVPKSAVLTDDSQSEFWVMKLINDTTAVKTDIQKGIENNDWVEIKSGDITPKDRIVVSGNFGMNDTAFVKINP